MNSLHDPSPANDEEEWQIIPTDWWRTRYSSISWSYRPQEADKPKARVAKPPYYHDSLFINKSGPVGEGSGAKVDDGELALNPELVGVKAATNAPLRYESDVGFYSHEPLRSVAPAVRLNPLCLGNENEVAALNKSRWGAIVAELTAGGHDLRRMLRVRERLAELDRKTQSASGASEASSERGSDSARPPQAKNTPRKSDGHIKAKPSPTRPLNAEASTFIPINLSQDRPAPISFLSFPSLNQTAANAPSSQDRPPHSPTFTNFVFPSLAVPAVPNVKIKKDDQGFYAEVSEKSSPAQRPSSALLPPFLQDAPHRRKAPVSKTRAIVDKLRSTSQSSDAGRETPLEPSGATKSHAPSPSPAFKDTDFFKPRLTMSEDGGDRDSNVTTPSPRDEDGWIGLLDSDPAAQDAKAKRTRELCLALTRRRTDSMVSTTTTKTPSSTSRLRENSVDLDHSTSSLSSSPSPKSPLSDGWIEGTNSTLPSTAPSITTTQNEPSPTRTTPPRANPQPHIQTHKRKSSNGSAQFFGPPTIFTHPVTTTTTPMIYPIPFVSTTPYVSTPYYYASPGAPVYPGMMAMPYAAAAAGMPNMAPHPHIPVPPNAGAAGGLPGKWPQVYPPPPPNAGFMHPQVGHVPPLPHPMQMPVHPAMAVAAGQVKPNMGPMPPSAVNPMAHMQAQRRW
ncbi:hypothetical protein BDN72DRAFT_163270 [Pluteus cervinus]|uniref:Uncharacterized protein n=1 Tax=Pluteus cervinus TaxID=181527 RepID=A0ACD3AJZ1_9AGAR|nr:hypothetical protein BDN72DRAFT_163270 [Pluteus cervinus]